jgi:hypothetical protein
MSVREKQPCVGVRKYRYWIIAIGILRFVRDKRRIVGTRKVSHGMVVIGWVSGGRNSAVLE